MVSSGGGGTPKQPSNTQSFLPPPGLAQQPYNPAFTSFLPNDNSMATGLSPEMMSSINTAPAPAAPMASSANSQFGIDAMRAEVAKMIADSQLKQRADDSEQQQRNQAYLYRANGGSGTGGGRGAGSGYGGSARGGPGGFGGSSARGGRAY